MNHTFLTIRQRISFFRWTFDSFDKYSLTIFICFLAAVLLSQGCSTVGYLVGNADPVSHKARLYQVKPMTEMGPQWKKIDPIETSDRKTEDVPQNEISDLVYQSQKTASLVSLNSSCRGGAHWEGKTLQDLTNLLLIGIHELGERQESTLQIDKEPALKTQLTGVVEGRKRKIETIVILRDQCVYDLMYFSSEKNFAVDLNDFEQFVASLTFAR